jgi:predicted enzyme related to lactoylglutathione lyase
MQDKTSQVRSLGWFNRFIPESRRVSDFYRTVVDFPILRSFSGGAHPVEMFWAGEALLFELIFESISPPAHPEPDPDQVDLLPVFRVSDLEAVMARVKRRGGVVLPPRARGAGTEAFVADPNGQLIGLRARDSTSSLKQDVEARRRQARGEAFNPGCKSQPVGLFELGWLVRPVADLARAVAYYRDVLQFSYLGEESGRALFDLGDNSILELAPGGKLVEHTWTNRAEAGRTAIIRVGNLESYKEKLRSRDVRILHELIEWDRGRLCYFLDLDNKIVGIEERHHPGVYAPPNAPFPEDLEAERRWAETASRLSGTSKL